MSDIETHNVSETVAVTRDPVTGQATRTVQVDRSVNRGGDNNWALWVAGLAVFAAALVIALLLLGRNDESTQDELLAAQAATEAERLRAEQALMEANQARIDAATTALSVGSRAADSSAAASAAAAEAAAARANAAADAARTAPPPAPAPSTTVIEEPAPEPPLD